MTENGSGTFVWTSPAGVQVRLPHQRAMSVGLLRRVRSMEGLDALFAILEAVCDEDALAAVDELTVADLEPLMQAWQGATVPDSSPSSS